MGNVDGRAIIAAWSENVLRTRFEDLDPATVDNAKSRIIDTIGCAIGGAGLPENAPPPQLGPDWGRSVGDDRPQALEPWGTVTTFGAAAIAGRLLGLDGPRLHHAFGIALNMIAGVGSGLWHGATMFKLSQGTSARSGINAAQLARAGWTGLADPLFGEHGSFFAAFADGCDHPETLTNDLGKKYHVETTFKPYPGGGPTQAPTGEALALARNEDYDEEHVRDPRVLALIDKVTLADLNRSAGFELEVRLKDGRRLSEPSLQTVSDRGSPFPRNALNAKFMTQGGYSWMVGKAGAERLLAGLERLEEDEDVRSLVALAVR